MKKIFIVLTLLLIFPLLACSNSDRNTQIIRTYWKNTPTVGGFCVVDSYEELTNGIIPKNGMIDDIDSKIFFAIGESRSSLKIDSYDEAFFENNSLVFVVFGRGSSSISYKVKNVIIEDGILELKIKSDVPRAVTGDIINWTVVVEVTKEEANSIKDTNIIVK
jgi:hypothetical protein